MEETKLTGKSEPHDEILRENSSSLQGIRDDVPTAFTINFDGDHPTTGNSGRKKKLIIKALPEVFRKTRGEWPYRPAATRTIKHEQISTKDFHLPWYTYA